MPITMQKRRYPKQHIKTITYSDEKERNGWCGYLVSRLMKRIPAALVLLFLVFVWSSSTTFISGSVFHICVASRKLNNHLYCISSGTHPSNLDIPYPITKDTSQNNYSILGNVTAPPSVPISAVFRTPLSSLSNAAKESVTLTKNVKAPSAVGGVKKKLEDDATSKPLAPIIQMPLLSSSNSEHNSGGEREDGQRKAVENDTSKSSFPIEVQSPVAKHLPEEAKDPKNKTTDSIIQLPEVGNVKSKIITAKITPTLGTESESPATPTSITIREKIEDKTKKEVPPGTPASITAREKMENKTKIEEEMEIAKKDVEEQMGVLRLYKKGKPMNYSNPKACNGKGIFVYDLPPKFNKDLVGHCTTVDWLDFCKFLSNNAFGEPVPQLGDGWYNTHQYALEPIFHARVLKHPCRVHNPEEAKVFYVPYYGGLDILRWHFNKNITIQMKDKLSYELIEWLSQQAPWKKNFGLDHLFVLGKISWDFRRMKNFTWGTHFLDLDEMQSPMKLLIERHPWHINDVGVPHPSFFHPRSDNDIVAWQHKLMQMPRKNLVSFAGAPRPKSRNSIRSILIEQCTKSAPDKCRFFDCREARCTQPAPMVKLFTESEFCLQPAGDSATRKSVFDSLVAGCIPVLFSPFTAYYQYPWHLPENRSNYSVFVDQDEVRRREVNVVDRLAAISAARRLEMRRYIVYELLPGLVYADPEGKLERFEDAFSVAMNSVLERMSRLP